MARTSRGTMGGAMLVASLLLVASTLVQCRLHLLAHGPADRTQHQRIAGTASNATAALAESKRNVAHAPCAKRVCASPHTCYCCHLDDPEPLCFNTMDHCVDLCMKPPPRTERSGGVVVV